MEKRCVSVAWKMEKIVYVGSQGARIEMTEKLGSRLLGE
jgi:hypothetical protein